jgi:cytochrome c oxidase subunit III
MIPVVDVTRLPRYAFGHRSILWWGGAAYMATEGMVFLLCGMSYLYMAQKASEWPPNVPPPALLWGTLNTAILLASCIPNHFLKKAAANEDRRKAQLWLIVGLVFSGAFLTVRGLEFSSLNVAWDTNAYGSIVWVLLGFHTLHLGTDVGETAVLTALMFTRHGQGKRFVDCSEDADYWYFVVLAWVPVYFVVYLLPRMMVGWS